jgi:hypothetical protein
MLKAIMENARRVDSPATQEATRQMILKGGPIGARVEAVRKDRLRETRK